MLVRLSMLIGLLLTSLVVYAGLHQTKRIEHVIYITLDGARWQDVFEQQTYFPKFWQQRAENMAIYGMPGGRTVMEVASIPVSLPSYQSQMIGSVQACQNNECGRARVETLPEYLVSALKVPNYQVAVFSSWPVIADALESIPGSVYSNVGNLAVVDPVTGVADEEMMQLNRLQILRHHIKTNRLDAYTFAQAIHYFEKYRPVFLWISLVNADNEAHDNQRDKYRKLLTEYDGYLNDVFATIHKMKLEKNTMVIVTTDHGRGDGENWTTHGAAYPEAKRTWAFVYNGHLQPVKVEGDISYYDTTSVRPAIEAALLHRK